MAFVVKFAESENGRRFIGAVENITAAKQPIAFDCEGVHLSRLGSVEVVTIYFSSTKEVYLIDFGGIPCQQILKTVKSLFADPGVFKIIHDCRKDCDALFHLHGITIHSVHDTSCFHQVITGKEYENLNSVLRFNGIPVNDVRDNSVYKYNPGFWSVRPLSEKMIVWASSDVDKLLSLARRQQSQMSEGDVAIARAKSEEHSRALLNMKVCRGLKVKNPGNFIGSKGSNLHRIHRQLGVLVNGMSGSNEWYVYYTDERSLSEVRRLMEM